MTEPTDRGGAPRPRRTARCLICGKPQQARWRPFCSKRCADIDLGRWFGEHYRIASVDDASGDDASGDDLGDDPGGGGSRAGHLDPGDIDR